MKVNILRYLRDYSTKPLLIDRLLISSFLYINSLENIRNTFLSSFKISEKDVDYQNLVDFVSILSKDSDQFFIEDLIELFEFVISPSDRIVNGAIYTPSGIREYIVEEVLARDGIDFETVKIADIACGCAGFLFTAAKELKVRSGLSYYNIFQNQIFGLDIQSYSVARSKMLLTLLAISAGEDCEEFQFNLYQGDTLKFKWQDHYENFNGFEIIVGNPPYVCGRNLEDSVKENLINWSVSKSGNPDLYIPFFQIGYENLSANGALGFITMNTFFKSLNGRALRKYFEDNKTSIRIIDFGTLQIFKSKSTYTCICFLEKRESTNIEYYRSIQKELPSEDEFQLISYKNLDAKKGWNLHYNEIISKIESVGKPFGDLYRTRHGIATLRNDLFIFEPVAEDDDFFYLQNGDLYPIERDLCRNIINSNKLSRVVDVNEIVEKVIFPYDKEQKPKLLEEDYLQDQFPNAYNYLMKKRSELSKRDKGKGNYEKWFAFGRTQSLERVQNKMFFPKYSDKVPNYLISNDEDLMFYNGQAIVGHSDEQMRLIKKIMESRLFWFYIRTTSKPYSSNYFSLNGNYIRNFGIPDFTDDDIRFILDETDSIILDEFFEDYYDVRFNELNLN